MMSGLERSYVYPIIPRSGLGNCLFPWARAVVHSEELGLILLHPIWTRARIGPVLRRERDPRRYGRLFSSPPLANRLALLRALRLPRSTEEKIHELPGSRRLIVVEGMSGYFEPLRRHRGTVTKRFIAALRDPRASTNLPEAGYIAVHVRRGDYNRITDPSSVNRRVDIVWYLERVREARANRGDLPIVICSDGSDEELAPLLALPNAGRTPNRGAAADLLTLAGARTIIGSSSTFTAWGYFLGNAELVLPRGANHYLAGFPDVREDSN